MAAASRDLLVQGLREELARAQERERDLRDRLHATQTALREAQCRAERAEAQLVAERLAGSSVRVHPVEQPCRRPPQVDGTTREVLSPESGRMEYNAPPKRWSRPAPGTVSRLTALWTDKKSTENTSDATPTTFPPPRKMTLGPVPEGCTHEPAERFLGTPPKVGGTNPQPRRRPGTTSLTTPSSPLLVEHLCARCANPVTQAFVPWKGRVYHVQCFTCDQCGQELGDQFGTHGSKCICKKCLNTPLTLLGLFNKNSTP